MNKTFIIAEAGVNHNGKVSIAKKLVDKAKYAGADAIKFQTFIPDQLTTVNVKTAKYQSKKSISQQSLLKKLNLKFKDFIELKKYCKKKNIFFLSSAFDLKSLNFLLKLNLKFYKIPSGQINDLPYLHLLAKKNKKILLSTGMSNLNEITKCLKTLIKYGTNKANISLLHCNSAYPTPMDDVNLKVLNLFKKKFKTQIGLSDHSQGTLAPVLSIALGSKFIEKHFTLSKKMIGPDHKSSLDPKEFKIMVQNIRLAEKILGKEKKVVTKSEKQNIKFVRKSIVAKKVIEEGEKLSNSNITTKRPGHGVNPMKFFKVLGKKAKKKFSKDELIIL